MFALCSMAVSLGLLVILMHLKVRLGRAIVASSLVLGVLFKVNLEAGQAVSSVIDFFNLIHAPPAVVIFFLPFVVAFLTGITVPTVAITFPFLVPLIGTGETAKIGLETLAFSGVICGLMLTPVHLCLALSCTYFETSFSKIVPRLLIPVAFIAGAGILMAKAL